MQASGEMQTPLLARPNFIADAGAAPPGGDALGKAAGGPEGEEGECAATVFGTTVNLANTIIGAGLLTLPFAIYVSGGLLNALALFVLVAAGSACGFLYLIECCEHHGKFTYKEIGERALGVGWPVELVKMLYTFGTCTAYMVLIGDFVTSLSAEIAPGDSRLLRRLHDVFSSRTSSTILVAATLCFPLSLLRSLNALRFTSLLAIGCIAYTVLAVAGTFAVEHHFRVADSVRLTSFSPTILGCLPLMGVSLTGHYNAPRLYYEMRDRSESKFRAVVAGAIATCVVCYSVMALSGYLMFGDRVDGDILNNLSTTGSVAVLARLALLVTIVFSYPLVFNAVRSSAHEFVHGWWRRPHARAPGPGLLPDSLRPPEASKQLSLAQAVAYSLAFVTLHVAIALAVPQVEVVLGYADRSPDRVTMPVDDVSDRCGLQHAARLTRTDGRAPPAGRYNGSVFGTSIVYMCVLRPHDPRARRRAAPRPDGAPPPPARRQPAGAHGDEDARAEEAGDPDRAGGRSRARRRPDGGADIVAHLRAAHARRRRRVHGALLHGRRVILSLFRISYPRVAIHTTAQRPSRPRRRTRWAGRGSASSSRRGGSTSSC